MSKELKAYSVVASSETHNYINGEYNLAFEAYDADDVDAVLAEKDKEIAQLQAMLEERNKQVGKLNEKLEDAKATAYTESVDAGMRERKLNYKYWNDMADEAAKMKRLIEDGQIIYLDEYCNEKDWRIMHKVWKDRETECRVMAQKFGG